MRRVLSIATGVACSLLVVTSVSAKVSGAEYLCMYKKHICSGMANCYQSIKGQQWSFLLQTDDSCGKKGNQSAKDEYKLKNEKDAVSYLSNKAGTRYRFTAKGKSNQRLRGGTKKITYGAFYTYDSAEKCITDGSTKYENKKLLGKGTTPNKKVKHCMQLDNKVLFLYR